MFQPLVTLGVEHRARDDLAEQTVRDGPALAVRVQAAQIAVGHEVAVGIVPRPAGAVSRAHRRVARLREASAEAAQIAAEAALDRGLAVAEHVIRRPEARRDVLEVGDILDTGQITRRHEIARRDRL